jgi:uncharacterized protein (DUF433 family)
MAKRDSCMAECDILGVGAAFTGGLARPSLGRPGKNLGPNRCGLHLDIVYSVNDTADMPTIVQSCRIEEGDAALLSRQAKRRQIEVSTLSSLYLKEKALEEEFPGIGFRDAAGGREAYLPGQRVAVWEVVDVYREAKTISRTADHFGWPEYLVKCALAYAKQLPAEIAAQRHWEAGE